MKQSNRGFLTSILISLILACSSQFVSAEAVMSPMDTVKNTAGIILDKIKADSDNLKADPTAVYNLVNEILLPRFDFKSMSRWVLGKSGWSKASEAQRDEFTEQFKRLLVNTYGKALLEYSDQEIHYLEEKEGPRPKLRLVTTEITQSGSSAMPINYLMHKKGGEWKVIDVMVDGVSLIKTYRGEFSAQVRANGMDTLLATLKERNARNTPQ